MTFSLSTAMPRRKPLVACLAVVLGSAAIFATSSDANAAWQHKHDFKHPTRAHAATLSKGHLHQVVPDHHQALIAHVHAKFGAARAKNPQQPSATTAVTSCLDDGSAGTLRSVIAAANSGDTIDLSGLACSTITLATGAIQTGLDDLTITGPGAANLTIDAGGNDRAFLHYGYGTLTINKVTIANGYYKYGGGNYAAGGCILTVGSVALNDSVVTGCYAGGAYASEGGGIYSVGTAALTRSTVSNSVVYGIAYYGHTDSAGGGVWSRGAMTLIDSTITGNAAYGFAVNQTNYNFIRGGGVYGIGGTTITRSTIDTNYAVYSGGGISSLYGTTISNSTVANNYSYAGVGGGVFTLYDAVSIGNSTIAGNYSYHSGGGAYTVLGPLDLESTIIASNTSGDTSNADFGYYVYNGVSAPTGANNLIISSAFTVPSGTLTADPQLQPLANNGGLTQTMALLAGSPAIDQGNNVAGLATDQRGTGFARVGGASADIGAFELQVAAGEQKIPAPTLSVWAQWLLAGALGLLGMGGFLRRRHPSHESS